MQDEDSALAVAALVADTHVPDRVIGLHPDLLEKLQTAHPDVILHAGDVCTKPVLEALGQIAPVYAVRGNRDWFGYNKLPVQQTLEVGGVKVTVLHGHGSLTNYFRDKWAFVVEGYQLERYIRQMEPHIGDARVVVFGHTHRPVMENRGNVLYFNPGSAAFTPSRRGFPSFGLLKVYPQGVIKGEFVSLRGYKVQNRQWIKIIKSL